MSAFDNYERCNKELTDKDKEILKEISKLNIDFKNKVNLKSILGGKSKNSKSVKKIKGGVSTQANILAGVVCALLMGGSSALLYYILLQPGVSNIFGVLKPCNGEVEQIVTYLASFTTGSLSCAQRQTAFDAFVQKLQGMLIAASGLTGSALHNAIAHWIDVELNKECKLEEVNTSNVGTGTEEVNTSNASTGTEEVVSEPIVSGDQSGGRSRKNKNNKKRKTQRKKRTNKKR